jgi:hypothetical protein
MFEWLPHYDSFSSFALSDPFLAISRVSGSVFMFCVFGLVFGGTEGVGSRFYVGRSRTRFGRYRVRRVCFHVLCSRPVFSGTEGTGSSFHVWRSRTRFGWYRGHQVLFLCFVLPNSFSVVPRESGPVLMFIAPGLVLGGTEGVRSRFHVLRFLTHFRRYLGHQVKFSCLALPDSFWAVPRASSSVFMFCTPGLILGGAEGVGSCFHVLRFKTRFGRYRGCRVQFSCFVLPNIFWSVPRASGPVFLFCAPGPVLSGTKGAGSNFHVLLPDSFFDESDGVGPRFHILRSLTHFRRYQGCQVQFSCFAIRDPF